MQRSFLFVVGLIAALGFTALVAAQDPSSPDPADACPSPVAGMGTPETASPEAMTADATPDATPDATADATPDACPSPGATTVKVEMVDISYNQKEITIPANTDVTIELPNLGAAPHNFNIDALNVHSGDVPAGGSTTVTINAPAGTYEFYCSIPGHSAAGMVGTLIVQ